MELFRKPQTSGTSWSPLLSLFVIFNLLTLISMEAHRRSRNPEPDKPMNIDVHHHRRANYKLPQLYLADLDRAINHILRVQLVKVPLFKGPKLHTLHNIIALLHYLNPITTEIGKSYINNIYWSIKSQTKLSKDAFAMTVNDSELANKTFKADEYFGCRGSAAEYRGFNCSLWTLFHHLTVKAAVPPVIFEPGAVLWTLHGYSHFFMGCSECYQSFWMYVASRPIEDVKTHDDEILWLWRAHNDFNSKLAGDRFEDIFHPKKQFPPRSYCPKCRSLRGEWKTTEVLKYLKSIYSLDNLSLFGLDSK